ncbi:hypothetical protein [Flavipsychrobacter stenotrophus]|uniref:hypothetical protein n=1 Tax=Flavipsychrobacter stenotrophus TaxID=2077091 RepID=UPI001375144F|nr:hypothetical protein [Flavipsychrobacter stenotrophus]
MSADVLFIAQLPVTFSPLVSAKASDAVIALPFQIKENMVNHKKMVHPPSAALA